MSKILHPLFLLAAKAVYSQLVRENEFLKVENKILRSRVKDKVVPTPEERAELVRFGRELGAAIKSIISIVHPITFAKWLRWASSDFNFYETCRAHHVFQHPPGAFLLLA